MEEQTISVEETIKNNITAANELQLAFSEYESAVLQNPDFLEYLRRQRETQDKINEFWKSIDTLMLEAYERGEVEKSIKGDFGTITVAERTDLDINKELLPKKFFKRVVDEKKLKDTIKLEGKLPAGCSTSKFHYITKRLK